MDPRPAILPARLRSVRRIIAVTGGKGGIGKSSVATNLALALADSGRAVGLLDLDLWGPSDHVILGVPKPAFREDGGLVPEPAAGLAFMSIASIARDEAVLLRGEEAGSAILELLAVTIWGELDYLIVDMPPGFADILIDATRHLPRAEHLVVTTPSALTGITTAKTISVLRRLDRPLLGVVVNLDAGIESLSGPDVDDATRDHLDGVPVLARIGVDTAYEAAIGSPKRLRDTQLYRDVSRLASAIEARPA
jgi:ATP-binding protein involved in chromosome partitioning